MRIIDDILPLLSVCWQTLTWLHLPQCLIQNNLSKEYFPFIYLELHKFVWPFLSWVLILLSSAVFVPDFLCLYSYWFTWFYFDSSTRQESLAFAFLSNCYIMDSASSCWGTPNHSTIVLNRWSKSTCILELSRNYGPI